MRNMLNMRVFGFVKGDRFYTLKANAPKRGAVTVISGRLGTRGRKAKRGFAERADMRDFVERTIERKLADGYVQIA